MLVALFVDISIICNIIQQVGHDLFFFNLKDSLFSLECFVLLPRLSCALRKYQKVVSLADLLIQWHFIVSLKKEKVLFALMLRSYYFSILLLVEGPCFLGFWYSSFKLFLCNMQISLFYYSDSCFWNIVIHYLQSIQASSILTSCVVHLLLTLQTLF